MKENNNLGFIKKYGEGVFLAALLIATLLPLFILSFYCHPSIMDDYTDTNMVKDYGFWGSQVYFYFNWTGRYFTDLLLNLNPMVFNANWAYKLNPIIWLLFHVISTYWLAGKLFKDLAPVWKLSITALFIFSYIVLLPDITGVFWQTCLYVNFTPNFLTFFLLGSIIQYYQTDKKKLYLALSCLLTIAIIGSYETCMIYIDMILLLFAAISLLKKKDLFLPLTLLAVAIIFSIFSSTAPGNSVRALRNHNAHQFIYSLTQSIIWSKKTLINFHWVLFTLFASLLLAVLLLNKVNWSLLRDSAFIVSPWLVFLFCLAIPFSGMFVYFYSSGTAPPPRTVNSMWFYFAAGMVYFSFVTISRIKKRFPNFIPSATIKVSLYGIVLLIFIFRGHNITNAYKDIFSGEAVAFSKEMTNRDEYILSFKGDSCMIDSIQHIPKTLYFVELPEKINWMNTGYWEYYNKKYIGIKGRVHAQ